VKVEQVPWGETSSWLTFPFEDHVAYLAQRSDQTTVSALMRIGWETVGAIVQRVVARRRHGDPLDGLTIIGVDELSYRRHHQYVTVDSCSACSGMHLEPVFHWPGSTH